jgi:hypothetical protein
MGGCSSFKGFASPPDYYHDTPNLKIDINGTAPQRMAFLLRDQSPMRNAYSQNAFISSEPDDQYQGFRSQRQGTGAP